jgi:Tfp pilus assembly protein PilX
VLFVLVAVLVVALSAAQAALNAEKSARSERDRHVALQAAEAALADAERDIEAVDTDAARNAMFAPGSALGFAEGCGRDGASLGLCSMVGPPAIPAWQAAALGAADAVAAGVVPYGRFTGAALPVGAGPLPVRPPRYIIELMPYPRAGEDASRAAPNFYRITAIGFGANPSTRVVLQSFYRKATEAP